jgi:RND family efflux transporter MFP subunit
VFLLIISIIQILPGQACAQGPPPALVTTATVKTGAISPEAEFTGTVYFKEVADVASEVRGLITNVAIEEGQTVKAGDALVRLDAQLLEKTIDSTTARHGQVLNDLERASRDLKRTEALFAKKLIPEKTYDDAVFQVRGLEKSVAALASELEGLKLELAKKTVRAPFGGVIVKKSAHRGEWVEAGTVVSTLAMVGTVDIVVDVPDTVAAAVSKGMRVKVRAAGEELTGTVYAVVPRGDIKTRTFPVRIRLANTASLMEGMQAHVTLPTGTRIEGFIVPRDAVISKFGMIVVFVVTDSAAKMLPVRVLGYSGSDAAVISDALVDGAAVVVKGNERINDGQSVIKTGAAGQATAPGGNKPASTGTAR